MRPKRIQWSYLGRENTEWIGMLPGEFPPLRFALEKTGCKQYLVKSNLEGVQDQLCTGLENARSLAQRLFNTWAFSLFEGLAADPSYSNPPNSHESP